MSETLFKQVNYLSTGVSIRELPGDHLSAHINRRFGGT